MFIDLTTRRAQQVQDMSIDKGRDLDIEDVSGKVNLSSLTYILNESVAYSIRLNKEKHDNNNEGNVAEDIKNEEPVKLRKTYKFINSIGYNVGYKLSQLIIDNENNINFNNNLLDCMKFICRNVWKSLFGKQMDNLKTNHIDTFVLVDNNPIVFEDFLYLQDNNKTNNQDINLLYSPYLEYSTGVITGVMMAITGNVVTVSAEVQETKLDKQEKQEETLKIVYTVETR